MKYILNIYMCIDNWDVGDYFFWIYSKVQNTLCYIYAYIKNSKAVFPAK